MRLRGWVGVERVSHRLLTRDCVGGEWLYVIQITVNRCSFIDIVGEWVGACRCVSVIELEWVNGCWLNVSTPHYTCNPYALDMYYLTLRYFQSLTRDTNIWHSHSLWLSEHIRAHSLSLYENHANAHNHIKLHIEYCICIYLFQQYYVVFQCLIYICFELHL